MMRRGARSGRALGAFTHAPAPQCDALRPRLAGDERGADGGHWQITVTEYILIRLGLMIAGLMVGWLVFGTPVSGLALAILANLVPGILLRRAIHRRRMKFQAQLVDVLVLIQGAVRAGFSPAPGIGGVVRETEAPASDEFRRVTREVSLGLTLSQALKQP